MTTRIFVSPPTIENNVKTGRNDPTIIINVDGETTWCHEVTIEGPCKVVYDPDGKDKYGARVFVQTESEVKYND